MLPTDTSRGFSATSELLVYFIGTFTTSVIWTRTRALLRLSVIDPVSSGIG